MSHPVLCLHSNSKLPKHREQSSDGLSAVHELLGCPGCVTLWPPSQCGSMQNSVCGKLARCCPSDAPCFTPLETGRSCQCTPAEPTGPLSGR